MGQIYCLLKTATLVWDLKTNTKPCRFQVGKTSRVEVIEDEDTGVWSIVSDAQQIALTGTNPPSGIVGCSPNKPNPLLLNQSMQGVFVYFSNHEYPESLEPTHSLIQEFIPVFYKRSRHDAACDY